MTGPDFIIPGASKAGTTSLHHYLSEHDDIYMAEGSTGIEINFFNDDSEYEKGLDHYESYFDNASDESVLGEKTPGYFWKGMVWERRGESGYRWDPEDDVPSRIHDAYPNVKFIITLRNPATRAYSQYRKNYRQGREEAPSFYEAVESELEGERKIEDTPHCWVFLNKYSVHLGRWLELFDRDRFKFLVFEDWIGNPEHTLDEICDFLGVDKPSGWSRSDEVKNVGGTPRFVGINRFYQRHIEGTPLSTLLRKTKITHLVDRLNSKGGYPEMTTEEWELMRETFSDEIDKTEDIIGQDIDIWREELGSNTSE